jgi:hypothetical protein
MENFQLSESLCFGNMDSHSRYVDIQQNGMVDSKGIRDILTAFNGRVTKQDHCFWTM